MSSSGKDDEQPVASTSSTPSSPPSTSPQVKKEVKKANKPFTQWRAKQDAHIERRQSQAMARSASSEAAGPKKSTGPSALLSTAVLAVLGLLLSQFLTQSWFWGYDKQLSSVGQAFSSQILPSSTPSAVAANAKAKAASVASSASSAINSGATAAASAAATATDAVKGEDKAGPRVFTPAALSKFDGSIPGLPVLLSIEGWVYDVTAGKQHYGPGGSYAHFSGKDASRAWATACFKPHHYTHDLRGLSAPSLNHLQVWKDFFAESTKYPQVGVLQLPPIDPASPIPEDC